MISFDEDAADVLDSMSKRIARAITADAASGTDATGGSISSLTEAVMGTTAGLVQIADAINNLAEAIRERA